MSVCPKRSLNKKFKNILQDDRYAVRKCSFLVTVLGELGFLEAAAWTYKYGEIIFSLLCLSKSLGAMLNERSEKKAEQLFVKQQETFSFSSHSTLKLPINETDELTPETHLHLETQEREASAFLESNVRDHSFKSYRL